MPWDQEEVEGEAVALRAAAGFDAVVPVTGIVLAQQTVGRRNLIWTPELDRGACQALSKRIDDGSWVIEIARKLADHPRAANWLCTHEVGEIRLSTRPIPYEEDDRERLCNRIAAAALMPRLALRAAINAHGTDLCELATQFTASELSVALRLAEALAYPVAIVSEQPLLDRLPAVLRRGPPIPLSDRELYRWAVTKRRPHAVPAGLSRRVLTDRLWMHAFIGPRDGWEE